MPAAAVIPAPRVYIKVVAVKKLVVGSQGGSLGSGPSGPGQDSVIPSFSFGTIPLASPFGGASWVS